MSGGYENKNIFIGQGGVLLGGGGGRGVLNERSAHLTEVKLIPDEAFVCGRTGRGAFSVGRLLRAAELVSWFGCSLEVVVSLKSDWESNCPPAILQHCITTPQSAGGKGDTTGSVAARCGEQRPRAEGKM